MGNTVLAIDLSENEVDICRLVWGEQPGVSFEKRGIDSIGDAGFDIVLSNQVIEHVHNTGHYISEINRVMKSGGKMIISLPNIMNPRHFLAMLVGDIQGRLRRINEEILQHYDKTHQHIHAWTPQTFVALCSSAGFRFEKYLPMEGIAFPFRKPFRPYLYWKNKRLRNWSYTMAFSFEKVREVRIDCRD
jgi:2-polyprenyl-3-methyl-5-hydroxy-6-metoxy-1,4-benzoquinol methylase